MSTWTEHKSSEGRTFYYDRVTGVSAWSKPETLAPPPKQHAQGLSLTGCLDEPAVLGLARAIARQCGFASLPSVSTKPVTDPFCDGGRGGAFCCASSSIYLCEHVWSRARSAHASSIPTACPREESSPRGCRVPKRSSCVCLPEVDADSTAFDIPGVGRLPRGSIRAEPWCVAWVGQGSG